MSGPPAEQDPRSPRLRRIERGIEERLERMAREGELSGLRGEGRPFEDLGDDAAGDRWAAFRLMSNNAVLPGWAQLRREIEAERERLVRLAAGQRAWRARRDEQLRALPAERILDAARATGEREARERGELEAAVRALNVKVHRFNAEVPVGSLQLVPFRPEQF